MASEFAQRHPFRETNKPEERHNGSCYELVLAAIRQGQGEIYNRRHGNYDLRPTTQMPTECVPGRVAISPTICLSVSKSPQNVPKATKTDQKIDQKLFKNQSKRLPRSHFVPKAKFWADCKLRETKKRENLNPKIRPNCYKNHSKREVKSDFTLKRTFVYILVTIFNNC